jgi:hypothetical protein
VRLKGEVVIAYVEPYYCKYYLKGSRCCLCNTLHVLSAHNLYAPLNLGLGVEQLQNSSWLRLFELIIGHGHNEMNNLRTRNFTIKLHLASLACSCDSVEDFLYDAQ